MAQQKHLILERKLTSDQGTFGRLSSPGLSLYTAELPWRDNLQNISCIPAGTYKCVPHQSTKYKGSFRLLAVPGRDFILIHHGNWAGDKVKGLRSDSDGCILVGTDAGEIFEQQAVKNSGEAMRMLADWAGGQGFTLTVRDI